MYSYRNTSWPSDISVCTAIAILLGQVTAQYVQLSQYFLPSEDLAELADVPLLDVTCQGQGKVR